MSTAVQAQYTALRDYPHLPQPMPRETEDTPLLSARDHENPSQIPVLRARIVSTVVPVFTLSAASARDSLLSQYLVDRLAREAGHHNHSQIYTSTCGDNKSDSGIAPTDEFQAQAAEMMTEYNYVQCAPAFLACLLIGSYSDYLGRRVLLLLPVFTNLLKMIIIMLIIRFNLDLHFMFLAFGLDGLSGSWFVILLALYALTADISVAEKKRTFWMYFIACSSAFTEALANIGDGYLIKYFGFFDASLLLCSMMSVSFIVTLFYLPETLQNQPQQISLNPLFHIQRIFGFYIFDGTVRKRVTYCLSLTLFIVGVGITMCQTSLDALYQLHKPFCWDSEKIGYYAALRSAGAYMLGAVWLKLLQICLSVECIGIIGFLFQGVAFMLEAFVQQSWQFYLVPVLSVPATPAIPIIRSMLSLLAGPNHQGAVFSSIAVMETVCTIVAVIISNKIYGATVSFMPGAIYIVMSLSSFLTAILFVVVQYVKKKTRSEQEAIINVDEKDIG